MRAGSTTKLGAGTGRDTIAACLALLLLGGALLTGCAGGPLTMRERGALGGGMLGAGTGALIGAATGHAPWKGAAIGGGIGALYGGLMGDAVQSQEQRGYYDDYGDDGDRYRPPPRYGYEDERDGYGYDRDDYDDGRDEPYADYGDGGY